VTANDFFVAANPAALNVIAIEQTAAEFPFTYTYYGFGAPHQNPATSTQIHSERDSHDDA
jgi:hypothetical protein